MSKFVTKGELAGILAGISPSSIGAVSAALPTTGLLCEYRFEDTNSTCLDSSGNGNHGTYVGSPTMIAGGGFTAAQTANAATKYVVGASGALATAQTIYIAFDVASAPNVTTFNTLQGNSTGATNLEIMQNFNVTFRTPTSYAGGGSATFTNDTFAQTPTILALCIDSAGVLNDVFYLDGKACVSYHQQIKTGTKRGGVPWIGGSSGNSHCLNGIIYYWVSYSAYHTATQVAQVSALIRDRMTRRGNPLGAPQNQNSSTNNVVFVGDSITAGLKGTAPSLLLSLNVAATVSNYSGSGWTAAQIQQVLFGELRMLYAPKAALNVLVFMAGTNDVTVTCTQATADATALIIRSCCLYAQSLGWKVIVCSLTDRANGATSVQAVSNLLQAGWRGFANEFADLASDPIVGLPGASSNVTYFDADQLHPITAGNQRIADIQSGAVNRILAQDGLSNPGIIFSQTSASGVTLTNSTTETSMVGVSAPLNSGNSSLTQIASTTNTSTTVSALMNTRQFIVGQRVYGTGIPAGATVATIPTSTSVTISAAATATGLPLVQFGSIPIKSYLFAPGRVIRIVYRFLVSTAGAAQGNITLKTKIGSTVLATTGAQALPASLSAVPAVMAIDMTCVTVGATGTFLVNGELRIQTGVLGNYEVYPMTNAAVVTLSTVADAIMDVTATFSAASVSNIIQSVSGIVEQPN
jgi:lysophospholipase L1-like esterase